MHRDDAGSGALSTHETECRAGRCKSRWSYSSTSRRIGAQNGNLRLKERKDRETNHLCHAVYRQRAPKAGSPSVLKATTTASSCSITSTVGPEGVRGELRTTKGDKAIFESEVTLTGEASFRESGTIRFGDTPHRLHFSTVGEGHIDASADPRLKHGSVTASYVLPVLSELRHPRWEMERRSVIPTASEQKPE